jgi:2-dehydropantoate 2-reductase
VARSDRSCARRVRESFALGYGIYPRSKTRIDGSPTWVVAAMLWFLSRITPFRELLATGKNVRALIDVMVAAAPRANPTVRVTMIEAMKPS